MAKYLGKGNDGRVLIQTDERHTFSVASSKEVFDNRGNRNVSKFCREMEKYRFNDFKNNHLQQSIYDLENGTLIINKSSVEIH